MGTQFRITYEDGGTELVELEVRKYARIPGELSEYELWMVYADGREMAANTVFDEETLQRLDTLINLMAEHREIEARLMKATFRA